MLQHNGKYIFYFSPNDFCLDLDCRTCGGRIWIGDWEEFGKTSANLDDYLQEGDEVYLYWDYNDEDDKVWYKESHIKPDELIEGFIALKDGDQWYAESNPPFEYKSGITDSNTLESSQEDRPDDHK